MEELLSVTICDPLDFDEQIFLSWLKGLKSQEAAEAHIASVSEYWTQDMENEGSNIFSVSQQKSSGLHDLLENEILDHYRSYEFLEHYICQPWLLTNQIMIRIPDHIIQWVICQYYSLDSQVARGLLGKRLFKNRRELEDMSDHCHIPLISVTRQFENLHRIYLSLEDLQFQVNFMGFIQSSYALPSWISRKYACLLFLVAGRFDVNSKKRLQRLSCSELENCAAASMACLLPDLKTFLEFKSGSFDASDLDVPADVVVEDIAQLRTSSYGSAGSQDPTMQSSSASTGTSTANFPQFPGYSFSGDVNGVGGADSQGKSKSHKGAMNEDDLTIELAQPIGLMGRSQSAPDGPKHTKSQSESRLRNRTGSEMSDANQSPWVGMLRLVTHPCVFATEPDKQLLSNLRELRTMFTNDVCEVAVAHVKRVLSTMARGDAIVRKLDASGRLKSVLKSLTNICGHLSQSKEYRDMYDDVLNIVGESLQEGGLDKYEANGVLIACNAMIAGIKEPLLKKMDRVENSKKQRKINTIEMEWVRFMLCCRVCLWNMFDVLL